MPPRLAVGTHVHQLRDEQLQPAAARALQRRLVVATQQHQQPAHTLGRRAVDALRGAEEFRTRRRQVAHLCLPLRAVAQKFGHVVKLTT
eukprot:259731-Chlamydomonas_euryale.AAC.9